MIDNDNLISDATLIDIILTFRADQLSHNTIKSIIFLDRQQNTVILLQQRKPFTQENSLTFLVKIDEKVF